MRFENRTTQAQIDAAVYSANYLIRSMSKMIMEIENKNDFKYNSGTGEEIAQNLVKLREPLKIFTYKPFNPWTKAIGYFDGEAVYINLRKLPFLSLTDLTGNILHEYAHYCGYTHGNNYYTKDKGLYSVPYYLSDNIDKWI